MLHQISTLDLLSFMLALSIGTIVGVERSLRSAKEDELKGAGIRTFALVCILGFFLVRFFKEEELMLFSAVFVFSALFLSIPFLRTKKGTAGLTTSTALIGIFLTGMIFGYHRPVLGVVTGLLLLAVTSSKKVLHRFADILSIEELMSAVRFLIVAGILVPITYSLGPIHPLIGPGRVFDPLQGLMMVLFVSGISFFSYIIMKLYEASKGLQISAFIGGFVSSAAATASASQKCEKIEGGIISSVKSIFLSNVSMFIKDYIVIAAVGGLALAVDFVLPLGLLLIINCLFIVFLKKEKSRDEETGTISLGTPFALKPAVKFAILFTLIWVLSYYLQTYLGDYGIYMVSVGGLVSTTSVSASISSLYLSGDINALTSLSTMLLAFAFGSFSKVLIACTYSRDLSRKLLIPMLILSTTSFILVFLLNL
ncbi:MAG: MgtC/SapB family protein [Thermoplasmata archaeon]